MKNLNRIRIMKNLSKKVKIFLKIFSIIITGAISFLVTTNTYAAAHTTVINNGNSATNSMAPMLKNALPSVVNIAVRRLDVMGRSEEMGSGVIADAAHGYIITNAHVIKDGQTITVTLNDSRRFRAKIIGYDLPSDIAVIQIDAKRLIQIPFGDSDIVNVGDFVAAIGSPFGLQQTVTSGVVSGLERSNLGIEGLENFIQTDAPINPGNSGGALVDMQGQLIGINTAIITSSPVGGSVGVGLVIPSNMAKSVMEQLVKYGKVERGVLGVLAQNATPALVETLHLPSTEGALISEVLPNSPAAAAGIKSKDFIVAIMDKPIRSSTQLSSTVSIMRIGTKINLKIWRDNKYTTLQAITVDPEKIKEMQQRTNSTLLSGLELRDFNQLVNNEPVKGVKVLYVDDNSVGYTCGLRAGDVILTAANKPIQNIDELKIIANKTPKQLLIEVKRGMGGTLFMVLEQ